MGTTYAPPTIGASGLTIPSYTAILNQLIAQYQQVYGSNVYLQPDSPDYQFLSILALQASDFAQSLQLDYQSMNPLTATGPSLDLIGQLIGTARKQATASTATLTLFGTPGVVVTNGVVQDINQNLWNLPPSVTIGTGGSVSATATAQQLGAITANANQIATIFTPTLGWNSVTNAAAAVPGQPVEPDSQYRARLTIAQQKPSLSLLAGTAAAIAAVSGVTRSFVYENFFGYTASFGTCHTSGTSFTMDTGFALDSSMVGQSVFISNGASFSAFTINAVPSPTTLTLASSPGTLTGAMFYIGNGTCLGPAHSITAIVEGGVSSSIASAIYNNRNPGVLTNGTTTVSVTDPNNNNIALAISFTVLSYVNIYVSLNVHALTGYTTATTTAIQNGIVNYLNSLGIGESIVFSEIYRAASVAANPNTDVPLASIRSGSLSGYQVAQTTGSTVSGSANVSLASATGVATGQTVVGSGVPNNTTVSSIGLAETLTVATPGTAYSNASGLATTGGSGTGLTVTITTSSGGISTAVVVAPGTGYVVGDVVTVVQGGASGGTLNITVTGVQLSANATATAAGVPLSFFVTGTADIAVGYSAAAKGSLTNVVVSQV